MVEFGYTFVLGRSPDYHAETFRLYAPYKLAKAYLLLGGLDFARYGNLFGKWNQHRMNLPVKDISVVSLGPFDEIGSFAICTEGAVPAKAPAIWNPASESPPWA